MLYLSIRPSVVCCQTCEQDILKTNEPILTQSGTRGLWARTWNDQLRESRGQKSRSKEAEVRFGSLVGASSCWVD